MCLCVCVYVSAGLHMKDLTLQWTCMCWKRETTTTQKLWDYLHQSLLSAPYRQLDMWVFAYGFEKHHLSPNNELNPLLSLFRSFHCPPSCCSARWAVEVAEWCWQRERWTFSRQALLDAYTLWWCRVECTSQTEIYHSFGIFNIIVFYIYTKIVHH